jgi:hypothetical protein
VRRRIGRSRAGDVNALLATARKAPVGDHSDAIAARIAAGHLTRERSCDGKTRFTSYDFAARVGAATYKKEMRVYACPFCGGWHLASARS